ncbi:AI-2E family transporter [Lactovum miscens]|uniref:Putative PurR-regulated permease PerM n=1 Tax=Lactovum miscens TaxID=190387 RepID=A0A841C783_9LACT|nr:AI-2E family transporter [Lactovum miscens]MBB5888653.1 putative PurR-regulated permease PerM [Lactovum miscens]
MEEKEKYFKLSWFYKWIIDNKVISFFIGMLLILLNIFLLYKIDFIFQPILSFLGIVLFPIVLAGLFYYLLNPIVDFAESKRLPRTVTISILFTILLALLSWAIAVVVPAIMGAAENFIKNFPSYLAEAERQGNQFVRDYNLQKMNINVDMIIQKVGDQALSLVRNFYSVTVSGIGGFITTATGIVIDIIIFPFILFYLLRDGKTIGIFLTSFLPNKWRTNSLNVLRDMNKQLSSFIRGEVLVALAVAIIFSVGLSIIQLPFAIPIAILAGIFNLIPYLGSFLAFAFALVVAALVNPWMILKVVIVFIIEQTIEGRFVQPLVIGSQMKIHPISILFILLTAGSFFGVWGVFLGIPVYAILKVLISHFYDWYTKQSPHFIDKNSEEE